jgi:ketosteroid isomerase-like protein
MFRENFASCDFVLTPYVNPDYYPVRRMEEPILKHRLFRSPIGLAVLVLLAGAALMLQARADPPHPGRKDAYKHQVEKLEEVWRSAQLNADVDAMDKLLSDDYVGITMTGQLVTKTQQLDRLRNRSLVLTKIELSDVKVKLIGTTAIVLSLAEVDGTNDGEPMHGTYRYTRVYSRLPSGTWKITSFEATRVGQEPPPRDRRRQPTDQKPPE